MPCEAAREPTVSSFHTTELSLGLAPRRSATFRFETSFQEHWRWVFGALVIFLSLGTLGLALSLVPKEILAPEERAEKGLGRFEHFNMLVTVSAMQITAPFVAYLVVRHHTSCQKDLAALITLAWTGQLTLATKYILNFIGVDHGLGIGLALLGLLLAGLKLEHILIHGLMDVKAVLHIDLGIAYLFKLLTVECIGIGLIVLLALFYELLEAKALRIVVSLVCWAFLAGLVHISCVLVRSLSVLARAGRLAQANASMSANKDALHALSMVRGFKKALALNSLHRLVIIAHVMLFGGFLWPAPEDLDEDVYESWGNSWVAFILTDHALASNLWFLVLVGGIIWMLGLQSVAVTHQRHVLEKARIEKRAMRQGMYRPAKDEGWQQKVEDLARRAISLDALLRFYQGLGKEYMHHFDSERHTTDDVVRQAIIPLSAKTQSDMSRVLMKKRLRPSAMVTHTWHSRFRDLVAAVVAEALEEQSYLRIGLLLDSDINLVRQWLKRTGELHATYWICAFCVNQHSSICSPSFPLLDSVLSTAVPACHCGCPKYLNTEPPCRKDVAEPMSVHCEMNKFSDMISWLAATDSNFRQVLAIDSNLEVFSRAWCMAEIAEAYMMGMKQLLLVEDSANLTTRHAKLQALKIEDMKASRPEDVQEILRRIPDKAEFNAQLQRLFGRLFGAFWHLHPSERLMMSCREIRWQLALGDEDLDLERWDVGEDWIFNAKPCP